MNCKQCGSQFEGKFCPNCGAPAAAESTETNPVTATPIAGQKVKKPFYKKWWFWVIVGILAIGLIGSLGSNDDTPVDANIDSPVIQDDEQPATTTKAESKAVVTVADFSLMSKDEIEAWASENQVNCKFSEDYSDTVTEGAVISQNKAADSTVKEGETIKIVISKGKKPSIEYQNALKKAESYSTLMHMSKKAIYDQLTSEYGEQFPADAAQYAIEHLDADYKANALEKAKTYQQYMSMSKNAIYDQLISEYGEKFTAEEAQYAIDHLDD